MPVSILPFDPNPDGTCRVCRGALDTETLLCLRCGAAHGERNRCPHCHSVARTLPHKTLFHRCSVCGKPRLFPGPSSPAIRGATSQELMLAGQSFRTGTILRFLAYALLGFGLLFLLLGGASSLILSWGAWLTGIALAPAAITLALWLVLSNRSRASARASHAALERAYCSAILDLLRQDGVERDADTIARVLGLPLAGTEALLAQLNADDRMTSRVTDEGSLLYGASATPELADPRRVRVAPPPAVGPSSATVVGLTDAARTEAIVDAEFADSGPSSSRSRHHT